MEGVCTHGYWPDIDKESKTFSHAMDVWDANFSTWLSFLKACVLKTCQTSKKCK
jgi:hypothetical protein